jgi:hypothetical protein
MQWIKKCWLFIRNFNWKQQWWKINKNATLNHPLYDDELKSTIEENIHNTQVQQNDVKIKIKNENIEIKYMLCNASTTCYVFEITKTLEFIKNEKKIQHI